MSDSKPLLSILMPTRNRWRCARHAITNILRMDSNEFELIVHDNSDDEKLAEWISAQGSDPRLRYFRTRGSLSITQTFERAIGLATGEFVCCLGDDDGVSQSVLELTRWMDREGVDALSPTLGIQYYWPGVCAKDTDCGRLLLGTFSGKTEFCDPEEQLLKCVRWGGVSPHNLPRVYHGVVRLRCLEEVRKRAGRYIAGVSPDMAASVGLASCVNKICRIDYPVFIPGASANSGAGRGVQKKHVGDLSSEEFLDNEFLANWPREVPPFFSGPTMWSAATVQTLRAMGRTDILGELNLPFLHASCAVFVLLRRSETLVHYRMLASYGGPSFFQHWGSFLVAYGYQWCRRAQRLVRRTVGLESQFAGREISNIDLAMLRLGELINGRQLHPTCPVRVGALTGRRNDRAHADKSYKITTDGNARGIGGNCEGRSSSSKKDVC